MGTLFEPQPLHNVGLGLSITLVATTINGGVALVILRAGWRLRSITLRADANHLLADVPSGLHRAVPPRVWCWV